MGSSDLDPYRLPDPAAERQCELDRLRAENARLRAGLRAAESFASAHEAWEAAMLVCQEAWEPGGMATYPRIVGGLYDAALRLQAARNRILADARDAGRVAAVSGCDDDHHAIRMMDDFLSLTSPAPPA